jgi:hypothetical protein
MADYSGYQYRCGYCGNKGDAGRCVGCGSGMEHVEQVIEGAKVVEYVRRWLRSRDRGWEVADGMRAELALRRLEDREQGRDPKRFDGIPDPFGDEADTD